MCKANHDRSGKTSPQPEATSGKKVPHSTDPPQVVSSAIDESTARGSMGGVRKIADQLANSGVSRRSFLGFCTSLMAAAPFGLSLTAKTMAEEVAEEIEKAARLPVIWLHMQDCTGCSETLLRTSQPDLAHLLLNLISLEYHETLMAGSGHQAEERLEDAIDQNANKYILVVEGSIPKNPRSGYLEVGGVSGVELLEKAAQYAAAIVAIGSCATWGGIPSADPNPTEAVGVSDLITNKPVVNIPGCPPNPYTLLGTVLEFASVGTLPDLDDSGRPLFAYDRRIHDHCPRRPHFDSGRFVGMYGDNGHRLGWCLYHVGCKGPDTHAPCSTRHFNEVVDAWPIGIGAPCFGCTEKHIAFRKPLFEIIPIHNATPPNFYPTVEAREGHIDPLATAIVGLGVGALAGATYMASRRLKGAEPEETKEEEE